MTSSYAEEPKEITLSPEVRRIRNSIIKKFADEPLDIMAKFVKDVVDNEEDTVKRLGAMAARVEILRMRIAQISEEERPSVLESAPEEVEEEEHLLEDETNEIVITNPNLSDWVRLRIMENSEINGVRFPKGVVIDVSQEDGDRLLEAGKASYVNEDEIADVKSDVKARKAATEDREMSDIDEGNKEISKELSSDSDTVNKSTESVNEELQVEELKETIETKQEIPATDSKILEEKDQSLSEPVVPSEAQNRTDNLDQTDRESEYQKSEEAAKTPKKEVAKKTKETASKIEKQADITIEETSLDDIQEEDKAADSADEMLAGFNLDEDGSTKDS